MQNFKEDEKIKNLKKYFRGLGDAHGLGIDKGILDIVVYLNALGFYTTSSCEGHLKWGLPYAWINFGGKTSKKELKLSDFGKSVYWNVFNRAREIANIKTDTKYKVGNKKKSLVASRFWDKIFENELKANKNYLKFKAIEKNMYDERKQVFSRVAKLFKPFVKMYNYNKDFFVEFLSDEVRVNFSGTETVNCPKNLSGKQKLVSKNQSDKVIKDFSKYIKKRFYGII